MILEFFVPELRQSKIHLIDWSVHGMASLADDREAVKALVGKWALLNTWVGLHNLTVRQNPSTIKEMTSR